MARHAQPRTPLSMTSSALVTGLVITALAVTLTVTLAGVHQINQIFSPFDVSRGDKGVSQTDERKISYELQE